MKPEQFQLPLEITEVVQCSDASEPREDHHLIWDKVKGWETRFTIDMGKKRVGKRIRVRLKTRDLNDAMVRRDLVLGLCRQFGLTVKDRRQKRQGQ